MAAGPQQLRDRLVRELRLYGSQLAAILRPLIARIAPAVRGRTAPAIALMKRHPTGTRYGAIGAMLAGLALVAAAGLTIPDAGAASHNTTAVRDAIGAPATGAPASGSDAPPTYSLYGPAVPDSTAPSGAKAVTKADKTALAPVTKTAISGLAANGIPAVALNAYRVAAARMAHDDPSCGIGWWLLAGIGREESDHGRFGGATLNANGTSTPRIIGPALTGSRWDFIPAPSDGAALDGDAVYAHALGPMQFIPSTWAEYGVDANGDGVADIFNINDAALAAARYLCVAGGDLQTSAGQTRAVFAYNHSGTYVAQVLALAEDYRTGVPVSGIPVGNVTGSLPPVHPGSSVPPVDPADPTAAQPVADRTPASTTTSGAPAPSSSRPGAPTSSTGSHPAGGTKTTPAPGTSTSGGGGGLGGGRPIGPLPSPTPSPSPTSQPTPSPTPSPTHSPSPTPKPSKSCHISIGIICLGS